MPFADGLSAATPGLAPDERAPANHDPALHNDVGGRREEGDAGERVVPVRDEVGELSLLEARESLSALRTFAALDVAAWIACIGVIPASTR